MSEVNSYLIPSISESVFAELVARGEAMASNAGSDKSAAKFPSDPSFVSLESKPWTPNAVIMAIDVGGTHTRVGILALDGFGFGKWKELLDVDNDGLNTRDASGKCLAQMTYELARLIVDRLGRIRVEPSRISGVGVIWSNQLNCFILPKKENMPGGVGGAVIGSKEGKAYRKGEWWNRDIQDGDDVSAFFIEALHDHGIKPHSFVIGNDTIFTCKALDGADSGMVASTGANATIVPVGGRTLCNSESGGHFDIACELVGLKRFGTTGIVKLEDTMTGRMMPVLFLDYLIQAAENGVSELKLLCESLAKKRAEGLVSYNGEDLSFLVSGQFKEFKHGRSDSGYPDKTLRVMQSLGKQVVLNGGKCAALMAYFSIVNQLPEKDSFKIALDSSQARYQIGYLDEMRKTMNQLMAAKGKKAEVVLLEPEGEVSVPMIGVARAVNDFLA